jgi:hypothetical protein
VTVQNCARNGAYYASDYPNNSYLYNDIYGYSSAAFGRPRRCRVFEVGNLRRAARDGCPQGR